MIFKYRAYIKSPEGLNKVYFERRGRMFEVEIINFEEQMVSFHCPSMLDFSFDDVELMPQIELLSKNNEDLYAGDIVGFLSNSFLNVLGGEKLKPRFGVIKWNEDDLKYDVMADGKWVGISLAVDNRNFELLGNQWEHPHLLPEEN